MSNYFAPVQGTALPDAPDMMPCPLRRLPVPDNKNPPQENSIPVAEENKVFPL